MTNEQLKAAKTELAKKALPHLMDPDGYGPSGLNLTECATLMTKDAASPVKPEQICQIEKSALMKLASELRSRGIMSAADCIPPRRA